MNKFGWFTLFLGLLLIGFATVQIGYAAPEANAGLRGRLVNSNNGQPWQYGAEISVIQTSAPAGYKGTASVQADGTFTMTFGVTDDLALCASKGGCTAGTNFANYQVKISYTCDLQTTNGTRPDETTSDDANCPVSGPLGAPDLMVGADVNAAAAMVDLPVYKEVQVTDDFGPGIFNLGDIQTGTGPTAVTLNTFGTHQGNLLSPLMVIGILLAILGSGVLLLSRRSRPQQT